MRFKVGDKVKVVHNRNDSFLVKQAMNYIGVVESIHIRMINIKFDKKIQENLSIMGFFEDEIEKINIKNQQLLFDFME
jgi:hypothetical protein